MGYRKILGGYKDNSGQNVTLSIPESLLKQAKSIAASKDKSLSEFLRGSIYFLDIKSVV